MTKGLVPQKPLCLIVWNFPYKLFRRHVLGECFQMHFFWTFVSPNRASDTQCETLSTCPFGSALDAERFPLVGSLSRSTGLVGKSEATAFFCKPYSEVSIVSTFLKWWTSLWHGSIARTSGADLFHFPPLWSIPSYPRLTLDAARVRAQNLDPSDGTFNSPSRMMDRDAEYKIAKDIQPLTQMPQNHLSLAIAACWLFLVVVGRYRFLLLLLLLLLLQVSCYLGGQNNAIWHLQCFTIFFWCFLHFPSSLLSRIAKHHFAQYRL